MWGWYLLNDDEKASILRGIRANRVYGGPYNAEIHPTDRCNARCFFCSTTRLSSGKDQIASDVLLSMVAQLVGMGLKSIRLSGGGEPLFHPARDKLLDSLEANRVRICNITTNALLLSEDISDYLVRNKCDEILISLNASTRESYEYLTGLDGRLFDRVCDHVKYLSKKKLEAQNDAPRMVVQFVILNRTSGDEISKMYELGKKLGGDQILIRDLEGIGDHQVTQDRAPVIDRALREIIERDRDERRLFLEFRFSPLRKIHRRIGEPHENAGSRPGAANCCIYGWYSLLIRASGRVEPCCGLQNRTIGNIYEAPLKDIWHGDSFASFRAELRKIIMRQSTGKPVFLDSICLDPGACVLKRIWGDQQFLDRLEEEREPLWRQLKNKLMPRR